MDAEVLGRMFWKEFHSENAFNSEILYSEGREAQMYGEVFLKKIT